MALDGIMLGLLREQLNRDAIGARVEKITMPNKDRIVLFLSKSGYKCQLLICINPGTPRINITTEKFENPQVPPMLCMLLRKRLVSGRLLEVRQAGIDRVLLFDFDTKNELGDNVVVTVAVEMLGRLSNCVFIENGRIIDCLRRFDPEEGKRFMLPNAVYELPENSAKINIATTPTDEIIEKIKSFSGITINDVFCSLFDGMSASIAREIVYRAEIDFEKDVSELNSYQISKLADQVNNIKNIIKNGGEPTLIKQKSGKMKDFTFIPLLQYGNEYINEPFDDFSSLIETFYSKRDKDERARQLTQNLTKSVNNLYERTSRKIVARQKELKSTENKEQLREYGELIKANLHLIHAGDSFLECANYYDEECKTVRIPLDVALSPFKNAQRYFKNYRKKTTAANMLNELIEKAQNDLIYLDSVRDSLTRATTSAQVEQIKQELVEVGLIRATKSKLKPQKAKPERYISSDGFEIYVGKNNIQNDYLTTKFASKLDIWFHTKNIPGSHVIVITNGENAPDRTLEEAAILAATNSKASTSRQVPVDYTQVKNVKKPNGSKPGMVIYLTNQTAFVDPDESIVEKLKGI